MNANEIIADIHRHREALACACGYDVKKLMDYYRRREREHPAAGHRLLDKAATRFRRWPLGIRHSAELSYHSSVHSPHDNEPNELTPRSCDVSPTTPGTTITPPSKMTPSGKSPLPPLPANHRFSTQQHRREEPIPFSLLVLACSPEPKIPYPLLPLLGHGYDHTTVILETVGKRVLHQVHFFLQIRQSVGGISNETRRRPRVSSHHHLLNGQQQMWR